MNEAKDCVPIVTGNIKYAGLTIPEIAMNIMLFCSYYIVIGFSKSLIPAFLIQIVLNVVYIHFLRKLEENFIGVIMSHINIPDVIWGFSNILPIRDFRSDKNDPELVSEDKTDVETSKDIKK